MWDLHEVGEVGHPAELVQVRRGEVLWLEHLWDLELPLSNVHRPLAVLQA